MVEWKYLSLSRNNRTKCPADVYSCGPRNKLDCRGTLTERFLARGTSRPSRRGFIVASRARDRIYCATSRQAVIKVFAECTRRNLFRAYPAAHLRTRLTLKSPACCCVPMAVDWTRQESKRRAILKARRLFARRIRDASQRYTPCPKTTGSTAQLSVDYQFSAFSSSVSFRRNLAKSGSCIPSSLHPLFRYIYPSYRVCYLS